MVKNSIEWGRIGDRRKQNTAETHIYCRGGDPDQLLVCGCGRRNKKYGSLPESWRKRRYSLRGVMETVEGIDVDSLNETIQTLNKIIDPLRTLMGG